MVRRMAFVCLVGAPLLLMLMPSAAAGGGCHAPSDMEMTASTHRLVGIADCAFRATVVYIEPGQEVRWVNNDYLPHTVSGAALSWGNERMLDQSDRVSYTFEEEGVYPYYCALHPSMVGAVVVGDATNAATLTNGMAAVTDTTDASAAGGKPAATEPATSTGTAAAIGAAIVLTLGIVALAARNLGLRRRAPSATSVP